MSVFSKHPLFSTLPHHKINSAYYGMSYHAASSQLVKKLDKKMKTIKMIQNQQPGEDTRNPITELQKELDDIKKNIQIWRVFTRAKDTASESGTCCTTLFPQSNVCKI